MADAVGTLSVVCDLGFGLPPQLCTRASLVATSLARRIGADEGDLRASFYVPLLMHLGCISMSHETAILFGNEIEITRAVAMTNLGDPGDILQTLIPRVDAVLRVEGREGSAESLMVDNPEFGHFYDTASAEVGRQAAVRMGLPETVQEGLYQVSEAWNGDGAPRGLKGEEIALSARITRLASDAAFFNLLGGPDLAIEAVRARAGTLHDPNLAKEFVSHADEILAAAGAEEPEPLLLAAEPTPFLEVDAEQLADVTAAFGHAADLKTPYTHGHSAATAEIVVTAGEVAGMSSEEIAELRIASHLHDVGRVAISNAVWEKPGPLSSADWEQVRLHTYHGERVVARSPRLEHLAPLVGMHHERSDGSGYHRGNRGSSIPMGARILAAADAWVAMQQPRPHRPALASDEAAAQLQKEADNERLDPRAVHSVLAAAGRQPSKRRPLPRGLSQRELEVLRLVAQGLSNAEVAGRLHISRRTAEHHVQHIYTKIGVSTRPGAAMFAVEQELLDPLGPESR
jgi:HD-GYP domain-containing protein (c-di-GMP phosphodiesterase class II)